MPDIDERVVQMKFDNAVFEKKIRQTISSLGQLEEKMNFRRSKSGLDDLERVAKKVELTPLEASVEKLTKKFSMMGTISRTVIANITTDAYKCGKKLNKIFSDIAIQPMKDGFTEYETQMGAIQTILANTKSKGSTMDDVTAALDELNTYADKTIYNFTEMTRNIGTFTAAGVGLEASTQAIKGIANLAAVSGSTSNQASVAMYQLSQALASGTVKLMDWNSVVNAGMGGEVFQNALKRTAKNMGFAVDEIIEKAGSFRESLSSGWLTSDVLTETLAQIAGTYDEATLRSKGYTDEQIAEILDLARTAEDAATKVKTWTQLVDTLKEALGSGWTKSWELIFGNFEQAQETFTSISNVLGGIIDRVSTARNSLLTRWSDLGGRTDLITGIINLFWDLVAVVEVVHRAWSQVFPPVTAEMLAKITKGFRELTIDLAMDQATVDSLTALFRGLFSILKLVIRVVSSAVSILTKLGKPVLKIGKNVLVLVGYLASLVEYMISLIDVTALSEKGITLLCRVCEKLKEVASDIASIMAAAVLSVINFVTSVYRLPAVQQFITNVSEAFKMLYMWGCQKLSDVLDVVKRLYTQIVSSSIVQRILNLINEGLIFWGNALKNIAGIGVNAIHAIIKFINQIRNAPSIFTGIANAVKSLFDVIGKHTVRMTAKATEAFEKLKKSIVNFVDTAHAKLASLDMKTLLAVGLGASLVLLVVSFSNLANAATKAVEAMAGAVGAMKKTLNKIMSTLNDFGNKLKSSSIVQLAMSLTALAGAVIIMSRIPVDQLWSAAFVMGVLAYSFNQLLSTASTTAQVNPILSANAKTLLALSASVLILSSALKRMTGIKIDEGFESSFGALTLLLLEVVTFAMILGSYVPQLTKGTVFFITFTSGVYLMVKTLSKLSTEQVEQFTKNAGAIAKAIGLLAMISGVLSLFTSDVSWTGKNTTFAASLGKRIRSIAIGLGVIAIDMIVLSKAVSSLEKLTITDDMKGGLMAIVGIMAVTVVAMSLLTSSFTAGIKTQGMSGTIAFEFAKRVKSLAIALSVLAIDMLLFSAAVSVLKGLQLSTKDIPVLITVFGSVAVLTAALSAFSTEIRVGNSGDGSDTSIYLGKHVLKLAAGVLILSSAMSILSHSVKLLSGLTTEEWHAGALGLSGLGSFIVVLMAVSSMTNKANAGPILSLSTLIISITAALGILSMWTFDELIGGAASLAIVLVSLMATLHGLSKTNTEGTVKSILTMVEIIGTLVASAIALSVLAEMPWSGLLSAAVSLAAVMIAVAFAAKLANNYSTGAFAMMPLAISVIALAGAFNMLATVEFGKLLPNLIALGVSMAALTALGKFVSGSLLIVAGMAAVAASFWIFAKGVEAFGAGANLLATGVEKVVNALDKLGNIDPSKATNIQNVILTTLISLGNGIGQGVAAIIIGITSAISNGIVLIATAISNGISIISMSISEGITTISNTACGLLFSFAGDAATSFINGVKSVASKLYETGKNFISNFINGIREKAGWHSPPQIIMDFINDASEALNMGVVYNEDGTVNSGHKFAELFNSGLLSQDFTATGKEWCGGIIYGIMGMLPDIKLGGENTFMAFVDGILNARKNAELKISKVAATSALELQIRGEYDPKKDNKATLLGEFGGADADVIAKSDIHSLWYKTIEGAKSLAGDALSGVLPEELSGLTDDISGLTNSIGGSAAASTNDAEAKQLQAKYISYVTSVAWKYAETFDSIDEAMGKSTGIESAREAVERFARAMADANSVDSTTGIEEYKKQFVELYESVVSAVDGIDKFTKVSRTMSKTAPKTYINNLKTNSKAITEWGNALQTLARKGFSTSIIRKIIDNGVSDVTMFNDFLRASSAEVEAINNSYVDIQNQSFAAADYAMSAMTRAAEMAAERQRMMQEEAASAQASADTITDANNKIAENADKTSNKIATTTEFVPQLYSTMVQSIEDTVASQVSILDAFSKDFDTTKEDILSNMASQVAGMYEYQDMILQLNETKISDDLLQYLISLGQDGWGYIREFTRMSEDELRNANNYYQQMQDLPQTCAVKIADGLSDIRGAFNVPIDQATTAGADLAQGFANGIDTTAANDKATALGDNSIDALKTALDTHSPSRKTFDEGENFDLGLAQGIESKKNLVVEAVQDLGEAMLDAIREVLDMHSPSRKLFNVGELSDQGLANGLINGIHVVATAAKSVGQSVFDNAKNGLQSYMNLDFDREVTPRITPVYSFAGMGGTTTPVRMSNRDNYVSAMASSINDIRNGKGPHYTTVNVDNSEVVTAINDLRRDIDGLKDSMSHMQVVMDTGATVGALAPGIDRELGKKSTFTKRGN